MKWNPTISDSLGIAEIMFWWIFQNTYFMEYLQIIDKFLFQNFGNFSKHGLNVHADS